MVSNFGLFISKTCSVKSSEGGLGEKNEIESLPTFRQDLITSINDSLIFVLFKPYKLMRLQPLKTLLSILPITSNDWLEYVFPISSVAINAQE